MLANSVDPNQTPCFVVSNLDQRCLPRAPKCDARQKQVNINSFFNFTDLMPKLYHAQNITLRILTVET